MRQILLLTAIIIVGFAAQFGLSRFLEISRASLPSDIAEADLYLTGETLKKLSFGFDGLIADYYWINSLQYVGNKLHSFEGDIQIDNLKPLNPRLLYPMLDVATTLDPEFASPYMYGSVILPAINVEQAIKISEKGIAAQPDNWRMYSRLGFIYWKKGDYKKAAEIYALGSLKPNAPEWVKMMSANMEAQGGSRDLAREMYRQMYKDAPNDQTREIAVKRLMQIDSFDERDAIRSVLQDFQTKNSACPNTWREVYSALLTVKLPHGNGLRFDSNNAPIDPSDVSYLLINQNNKCNVDLGLTSKVPYQ